MGVLQLLALSVGLSMDAFAVSVCKGLSASSAGVRTQLTCGLWFGGFQAVMPVCGFFLGSLFLTAIQQADHWIAFGLLTVVGINMLREASHPDQDQNGDLSIRIMALLALATSIDALAVGISLAMTGGISIFYAAAWIGLITALLSGAGVRLGRIFGRRCGQKAQICGGIILIFLAMRILWEHLGT